ncbi:MULTISPECIES: nucleoside 2-deoxyribosyltransferase [Ralstonia]|jgi:nucleoside 2-deoxyribosyltransferase|uniref:Nucleoside 2-deoxyribosyltransferase n=3 Tax=Pseudomonadota TaxID=1224 RepID=A0AAD2F2N5_9RALS|nr:MULTISPECIES: nucleoside 2-deoxyribosyltransferase [Ralstonia]MBT2180815.1 nucleoside 2-deoxyribosyltransferase [Ralstonia pickettii]MBX3775680.1 nucleoside 2-deoxyribosyltransferase [Ralstonia pickettii]MBX3814578.1 nucleoside 2-deoxyribosyltransferase [Ralstonia pickettii]MBX3820299.1 nucleoside 2-deoxyribosyltransferase [Ralstonia insidiosa]MBX3838801.1 nucleoside 2-deoxyribosyltransferase [Ralstonia insidiosa]
MTNTTESTHTMPRIYLAGPDLFFPDAEARYDALKDLCARYGLEGVAPTDGQTFPIEPTAACARRIREHDLSQLRSADAVLANITPFNGLEPDSGTAYEIGFAAALGMPVVAYCLDGLDTRTRTLRAGRLLNVHGRDDEGLLVENFGLHANLMLCAEHPTFSSADEAVRALAEILFGAAQAAA